MSLNYLVSKSKLIIVVGLVLALGSFLLLGKRSGIEPMADPWFQSEVVNEARPVLVKFGAEWCGPCRVMDQSIAHIEAEFSKEIKFVRVDVDKNQELAKHYRVSSIPRTFIFQQGKIIADQKGSLDTGGLKSWIRSSLAKIPSDQSH